MNQSITVDQWHCIKDNTVKTFTPPYNSLIKWIESYAQAHPKKEAIISMMDGGNSGLSITYREMADALNKSRSFLTESLKLKPGDAIAVLMENKPELLIINWAAWSIGLKTVPLDSKRDTLERKLYKLELVEAKVLFVRTDQGNGEAVKEVENAVPSVRVIKLDSEKRFFEIIQEANASDINGKIYENRSSLDDDCLIMFTSGTTSLPKGVRLTLRSLWANAAQIIHWLRLTEDDRFHILLPLHHINSTTFSLATILSGGTIVLSPRYSKSRFWKTMAEGRATLASIVPTIAYDLLSEQDAFDKNKDKLENVSRIQIGSAPVQVNVVMKFYEQYKIPLIQGYGSTETSLRCTGVPYGVDEAMYLELVQTNSIGTEMLYNNVAILDENCNEVSEEIDGEICIRGANVTRGYMKNPEQTENAFRGGWYHSGDLGCWKYRFGQKMLFIKGRLKEIIIKGGVNISPLALESTIIDVFPEIEHCFVIGFPHLRFGEEIGILVDGGREGLEELKQAIKEGRISGLLPYECPAALIKVEYEDLPKTSTGKIQRVKLKEKYGGQLAQELEKSERKKQIGF